MNSAAAGEIHFQLALRAVLALNGAVFADYKRCTFADFLRKGNARGARRAQIAVVLICVPSAFTCEIALAEPPYRFGVPPWQRGQSVDDIRRLYNPLLDYLGRATDAKITMVTARSYGDMVHYFADGRVDFGTISPMPYVSAQRLNPAGTLLWTDLSWDPPPTKRVARYQRTRARLET